MKKMRFTEEQMVTILREADEKPVPQVAKKHGVSAQTIYGWRKHFGRLEPTDVIFPESKEFLAGYWIVDVKSPERAYEIAAEASSAPGQPIVNAVGERIEHLWIEVRALFGSHKDR